MFEFNPDLIADDDQDDAEVGVVMQDREEVTNDFSFLINSKLHEIVCVHVYMWMCMYGCSRSEIIYAHLCLKLGGGGGLRTCNRNLTGDPAGADITGGQHRNAGTIKPMGNCC